MYFKYLALPEHGSSPYYSLSLVNIFGFTLRISMGGYDLTKTLDGYCRVFRILHYFNTATHISVPGFCFSIVYSPW